MPSIYIINPAPSSPGYYTAEAFHDGARGWSNVADLTIATVAAFVPAHWQVRLAEEAVAPADLDAPETFIAITGKVTQRARMLELADAFRARGKTVLIGGSFASLSPEEVEAHADILVTGELEDIAEAFFADLESGSWAARYEGGRADIQTSPIPRWDLYPVERAMMGALQTTRGCPFNCEFCDVIQYQGRKQRHKTIAQIVAELDALHAAGFRDVFLVDDNFTVHRKRAREVLEAIAAWNLGRAEPIEFTTQASLDVARDDELLALCRAAGLRTLFIGVETTNEDSLRETGKKQNLLMPMAAALDNVVAHGISIYAGIIVGFDHDRPSIFGQLSEFFDSSAMPNLGIGVLTAPAATDLYRRLAREGRLVAGGAGPSAQSLFETNIEPAGMSREELLAGAYALAAHAYSPAAYERRMLNFIARFPGDAAPAARRSRGGREAAHIFGVLKRESGGDAGTMTMVSRVLRVAASKPAVMPLVLKSLASYAQALHLLKQEQGRFGGSPPSRVEAPAA